MKEMLLIGSHTASTRAMHAGHRMPGCDLRKLNFPGPLSGK
jgi:hypothetical protein